MGPEGEDGSSKGRLVDGTVAEVDGEADILGECYGSRWYFWSVGVCLKYDLLFNRLLRTPAVEGEWGIGEELDRCREEMRCKVGGCERRSGCESDSRCCEQRRSKEECCGCGSKETG